MDTVAEGDDMTWCSLSSKRRGLIYAATCGGKPARGFWAYECDVDVTAGSPNEEFELPTVTIRRMLKKNEARSLVIPAHGVWGRSGG